MASRAGKRLWYITVLIARLAVMTACGEADQTLRVSTLEVTDGDFYGLAWGGTQVERFHVLARTGGDDPEQVEVKLISPEHAEPCSLGHVARYGTQQPRSSNKFVLGSPSPTRVAVFDSVDEHGFGTMSFADIDCKRTGFEVPDVLASEPLRLYSADSTRLRLGMRGPEKSLLLIDPWEEKVFDVADDADDIWPSDVGAWVSERGQLVKHDFDGRERRRIETKAVSEFLQLGLHGDLTYIDEGSLFLERAGKTQKLATGACSVRPLDGFLPGAISYYEPCSERRLTVRPAAGKPLVLGSDVTGYTAQRNQLFVVKTDATMTQIWMARPAAPDKLVKWVELPRFILRDLWSTASGQWMVIGEQPDKTVTFWRMTDDVPSATPVVVAEGVVDWRTAQRGLALMLPQGEMTLFDRDGENLQLRAAGVTRFGFLFNGSSSSLAYLGDVDMETGLGQLTLHFLTGEHFRLAKNVREYREVWWPERGIIYTRGGDDPAIAFARVEIPCEMTSDSPWTCGF
jgi:hypothetical protein